MPKSSTTHALVHLMDFIHKSLEVPKAHVRILLLDYSKAFDRVNHNIVLQKMKEKGTPDIILRWCTEFLYQRQQRVQINSDVSGLVTLNGGTPQGTLFGPKSFIVHVDDFKPPDVLDIVYVDDTTLCSTSTEPNCSDLQTSADYASNWANANDMKINAKKTHSMVFDFSRQPRNFEPIRIGDTEIQQVATAKLLGVTLSQDLSWKTHIQTITSKANQRLYMLWHAKRSGVQEDDLLTIYLSLIRPVIEYALAAWHPSLPEYSHNNLERIQQRALRTIFGPGDYSQLLQRADLDRHRARRDNLCKEFYIKMKSTDHKLHDLLPSPRVITHNVRNARTYPMIRARTNRYKNSTIPWCINKFD